MCAFSSLRRRRRVAWVRSAARSIAGARPRIAANLFGGWHDRRFADAVEHCRLGRPAFRQVARRYGFRPRRSGVKNRFTIRSSSRMGGDNRQAPGGIEQAFGRLQDRAPVHQSSSFTAMRRAWKPARCGMYLRPRRGDQRVRLVAPVDVAVMHRPRRHDRPGNRSCPCLLAIILEDFREFDSGQCVAEIGGCGRAPRCDPCACRGAHRWKRKSRAPHRRAGTTICRYPAQCRPPGRHHRYPAE